MAASSLPMFFYFYPRPPRGGRHRTFTWKNTSVKFLSTPSARRATSLPHTTKSPERIFLSTPSARRATSATGFTLPPSINFYPRPPRGGRQTTTALMQRNRTISIHALREEGDRSPNTNNNNNV